MKVGTAMVRTAFGLWPGVCPCTRLMPISHSTCASFQRSRRGSPKRRVTSEYRHSPAGRSARQFDYKFSSTAIKLRLFSHFAAGQFPVFRLYEPVLFEGCVSRIFTLEDTLKRIPAFIKDACRYTPRVHLLKTRGHCPWRHRISAPDQALKN